MAIVRRIIKDFFMRNKLLILAFILTMGRLSAAEFDPAACPDLSVKIFPGNNKRAVLLVSAQHYSHSGLGFEYVESSTSGSPARKSWRTILHIKMGTGKKSPMYYLTTISQDAARKDNRFELALDRPIFTGPEKTIPLKISKGDNVTAVFTSYWDAEQTKTRRVLKINLADNTAIFADKPERKLKVYWYADGFVANGLPKGADRFGFDWSFLKSLRRMNNGITVLRYRTGCLWGIFPRYEKFYLTKVE